MARLDPAIHVFLAVCSQDVDARHKAGHDELIRMGLTYFMSINSGNANTDLPVVPIRRRYFRL